jgi:hypothetical protein
VRNPEIARSQVTIFLRAFRFGNIQNVLPKLSVDGAPSGAETWNGRPPSREGTREMGVRVSFESERSTSITFVRASPSFALRLPLGLADN